MMNWQRYSNPLTFREKQRTLFEGLGARGWRLSSPTLKVRHATSPDGRVRVWFKPQALYYTVGRHDFGEARSLHIDPKKTSVDELELDAFHQIP